ncbi:GntR family transcriptional regulator [Streptomyces qinzhouensis]|uniref:Winged helix-turn-helix transcriptional regulator n=1 Tax=Streptomyces qinzhouensis TaxID=2599401 RepID=A0A5B8J8A9_9ACTN|nr:winged helix-turn-helix domain-containing protein [Streptomyces qinzhouensis]QDY78065.1 winged helix-turn-helix transcriptional regulator [Streptomyces qinzhouensis]
MEHELDRTRPIWRQIAEIVTERIASGTYPVGSRVPPVVELSAEFGVATSTVQKAFLHLKQEGTLRGEVGLGTFVSAPPERTGR